MINHWLEIHTIKFPDSDGYTYDIPCWKYEQLCNYMKSDDKCTRTLGIKEAVEIGIEAGKAHKVLESFCNGHGFN